MRTCDLTQTTKMEVLHSTNLSLFFLFILLYDIKSLKSKHLKKVTQFQTPPRRSNAFLKLRKQQHILRFLTNHSRFGTMIKITIFYNFLRVKIRIDAFTSPNTLPELESFITHSSLAGLGFSTLA